MTGDAEEIQRELISQICQGWFPARDSPPFDRLTIEQFNDIIDTACENLMHGMAVPHARRVSDHYGRRFPDIVYEVRINKWDFPKGYDPEFSVTYHIGRDESLEELIFSQRTVHHSKAKIPYRTSPDSEEE